MLASLKKPKISQIDREQVNAAIKTMVANDNAILPVSNVSPKIWYCDWYNAIDDNDKLNYSLYSEGEAVWLNTESLDEFTKNNINVIKSKILTNPLLKNKYENVKNDENALFQLYKDVVSGAVSGNKDNQPLFFIGDILEKTQIRVSLSNNNDRLPTDDEYWTDFFINNDATRFSNQIIIRTKELCEDYLEKHIKDYHLSGIYSYWYDQDGEKHTLSDYYLLQDMSNLAGTFDYVNTNDHADNGVDYVLYFHQKKFTDSCWKWFRVWRSGLLEHGGIVDIENTDETQDSLRYQDADGNYTNCRINLEWSDSNTTAPKYTYSVDSNGFYYDENAIDIGDKNKIQMEDSSRYILKENRYCVQVTPILNANTSIDSIEPYSTMNPEQNKTNGIYYDSIGINSMTNSSFCFNLLKGVRYYSYNVKGYSINSQQYYKN